MPTPPALAKDFEYCSVSIERHTPVPGVSPNGPSPLRLLVICENIELRNIASKSVAVALALACACGDTLIIGIVAGIGWLLIRRLCITSPRCRPGWRRRP